MRLREDGSREVGGVSFRREDTPTVKDFLYYVPSVVPLLLEDIKLPKKNV